MNTIELIERLEHTDELSGDSVWEVREALKNQLTKIAEHLDTIERLTAERDALVEDMTYIAGDKPPQVGLD